MKRKIIQISTLVVLAFIFTMSASAQTMTKLEAEIPFDFQIGDKTYEAGNYTISLGDRTDLASVMKIKNSDNKELQRWVGMTNGDRSKIEGKAVLRFHRSGDQYVLRKLMGTNFGFNAPKPKRGKVRANYLSEKAEAVSVLLKKPK